MEEKTPDQKPEDYTRLPTPEPRLEPCRRSPVPGTPGRYRWRHVVGGSMMPKIKCVECGKFFMVAHVRSNPPITCGVVCRHARAVAITKGTYARIKKKCAICGKVFFAYRPRNYTPVGGKWKRKTCSFECSRQWDIDRSIRWQKAHPKKTKRIIANWYRNNRVQHIANVRCYQARRAGITGATPWRYL